MLLVSLLKKLLPELLNELIKGEDMEKINVSMKVNGKEENLSVEPRTLLVHSLREHLDYTGAHIGCSSSHCGACTVDMDGKSVKSCTVFTPQAEGSEILTKRRKK